MSGRIGTLRRRAACVAVWAASLALAGSALAVVGDRPAGKGAPPDGVIIELTAPPAAVTGQVGAAGATGAVQRARARQRIMALENQHRAARGLGAAAASAVIRHEYGVVLNGFAARLMPETVAALQADPDVRRVVPDGQAHAFLDVSVPHVRAPEVWRDFGYRGAGTTIAIIDTGVDYTHPDLGGCLGAGCKVVGGYDFVNADADPRDDHGHGTHVAATAAGIGATPGVAPDAHILAYKVLDAGGSGSFSNVIAGIERAADPNGDGNPSDHATVISMSLGGGGDENDPVSTAVDNATAVGVLSVIAAGNSGAYFTIGSPGTARTALTVGATDDADANAFFSSRGPTSVDFLLKPEITAPGVNICAATIPGAFPGHECRDTIHASISGTSMATPHVSGAAALVRGLFPALGPAEVKAMLEEGAVPVGLDLTTGGAGRLDVRAAVDVRTVLSPAPLNFGVDTGTAPTWTRSAGLSIRNLDATPKTYTLAVAPGSFPAGVQVTVAPNPVTVAGGATATISVGLTVDNAVTPDTTAAPFVHGGRLDVSAGAEQRTVILDFTKRSQATSVANDTCASATVIGTPPFANAIDTTQATTDPADPFGSCACGQNGHSVWYQFTAGRSGEVTVDTAGSGYDTVLSVFTGSCGGPLPVVCNDDSDGTLQSQVHFEAVAGATYLIEVTSFCSGLGGSLHLNLAQAAPPPPNDTCNAATEITTSRLRDDVDVSEATSDPTDPAITCGCGSNGASVWYRFTAPTSEPVTIDTFGSSYDTILSVFSGACGSLTPVAPCNDDSDGTLQSKVSFTTTAGVTYLIEVTSFCGGPAGKLQLDFEAGQLLSGRSLLVRDNAGDPSRRRLALSSRDPGLTCAAPGTPGDPRTDGALLRLINSATGESDLIRLPASRWTGLGTPPGAAGYRYRDAGREDGPCSTVYLKPHDLRATCDGSRIDFTLDEPAQGSLGVRLTTGPAAYCMLFGGAITQDTPGTFKAVAAPAPGSCPISPASCEGLCGGSAETCFCDPACVGIGDCCDDYGDFCQP